VIGAGAGGLSVAAGASLFGEKVVLVERHKMGGDCLNSGCVPSKALLAAAKRAHLMRTCGPFGIRPVGPEIDPRGVHDYVKGVIGTIAPNDSVARYTGLGVRVIEGHGRFIDGATVEANGIRIKARRFIIATGSRALVPPIPGLDRVAYLTNETIFDVRRRIEHLVIIGGGPIGMEMAQAYRRLGSAVTVLEGRTVLGKDDPELSRVVVDALRYEGVDVRESTTVERVEEGDGVIRILIKAGERREVIEGTDVLVAAGRRPNIEDLGLDRGDIVHDGQGIKVNSSLLTSNPKVFAIGDCTGGLQFTHVANQHAGVVLRRALFRLPAKVELRAVPWVTYTDPELAHVGLSEEMARRQGHKVGILRWPFHENDRAQAEHLTGGMIKVVTGKRGRILGASIVGHSAGELIQVWTLAISRGLTVRAMADFTAPYPTLSEVSKRAATRYYALAPVNPLVRKVIGWLKKLG